MSNYPPFLPPAQAQASPTPQLQPLLMTPGATTTNTFSRMQTAQGLGRGQSPGAATPLTKQQTTTYDYSYVSGGNGGPGPGASPGGYQNAQFANSLPQGARSSQSPFPLFAVWVFVCVNATVC